MKLIRKLMLRTRPLSGQNHKIRGLSTAELVGIIVIVGILGALGGTYITNLITASKDNTGLQNAQSLTTVLTSAINGGATLNGTGTKADRDAGKIQADTVAHVIADLDAGVTVNSNGNAVLYQINPAVNLDAAADNYTFDTTTNSFAHVAGKAP